MNASQPFLHAENLACRRGQRLLFAGVSLTVNAGEALHLAGANGIGKSSLIRILAGLMRPFAGAVERSGAMALLDERPALDTHSSLGRALAFWTGVDGIAPDRVLDVALAVGLGDLLDVPVRFLSTGQRKRAALARTLGQAAPVWLLDEPLNGLDTASVATVERLVADHCAAGGICVLASHQPLALPQLARLELADFAA